MKITRLDTLCGTRLHAREDQWIADWCRSIKADIAVVVVETDTGVIGIGEASAYGNPLQIAEWVRWYAPTLIGGDVDDFSLIPPPRGTQLDWIASSAHEAAVAGIDCALWDARGKAANSPVSKLLNPQADDAVKVYASGGVKYDWRLDPTALVAEVIDYVEQGYDTVKFRLGTKWSWDNVTTENFIELYDTVHREVGDSIGLAVDGNCRLDRDQAKLIAFAMQDRDGRWLEEPIPKDDLEGHVLLNRSVDMPITGGEGKTTAAQFRPWIESGAFDVVQPDAGMCGITELMKVGRLAERHGVKLMPHSWHNGVMFMANAHAVAALPNSPMVEEGMVQGPLKWGVVEGGSRVVDGQVVLGDAPGFGIDIIDDLEERYPYVEGDWRVEVFR